MEKNNVKEILLIKSISTSSMQQLGKNVLFGRLGFLKGMFANI